MINSYSFGNITIDNQKFSKDLILYSDHITSNWQRKTGHFLTEEDITEIIDSKPEVLIICTGTSGLMKVDDKLKEKLKSLGIETIITKTADAVVEYNKIYKDKKVVAALHLTC
ncbi:MAG: MTH938/NDUFAF3 family protein [Cyanobacteria bacterium]|nr:MTH938/NDUFAF3 family protein [Cyanobacteriota bacterium]